MLYLKKLLVLFGLLKTFYFIYIFIMPVKKTVQKKTATKGATKTTTKHTSSVNVVEEKKPTVVVEKKKADRCECVDCNCGCSCNQGCCLKIVILVLVVLNLIISCICCSRLCSKKSTAVVSGRSAWDLEALKVWWEENLEKLKNDLYWSEVYKQAQKESIEAYMQQLWIE